MSSRAFNYSGILILAGLLLSSGAAAEPGARKASLQLRWSAASERALAGPGKLAQAVGSRRSAQLSRRSNVTRGAIPAALSSALGPARELDRAAQNPGAALAMLPKLAINAVAISLGSMLWGDAERFREKSARVMPLVAAANSQTVSSGPSRALATALSDAEDSE